MADDTRPCVIDRRGLYPLLRNDDVTLEFLGKILESVLLLGTTEHVYRHIQIKQRCNGDGKVA